jgi:carbonic anhydrase
MRVVPSSPDRESHLSPFVVRWRRDRNGGLHVHADSLRLIEGHEPSPAFCYHRERMSMDGYKRLLLDNERWVAERLATQPDYFRRLNARQDPDYVWIGCSDSRVPAETVTGCQPGELFVHRNVGNQVVHTDLNMLTVLFYAVENLGVKHIIVCGHYGCGGVEAAMSRHDFGLINRWLQNIKDCAERHQAELASLSDSEARSRRLVELNVIEQVDHLAKTSLIQRAWKEQGRPWLHGWVYDMRTGRLGELVRRTATDLPHDVHRYDL